MSAYLKHHEGCEDALVLDRFVHTLCLIQRDHLILSALEEDYGAVELVDRIDRRTPPA